MTLPGGQDFWKLASSTVGLLVLLYMGISLSVDPDRFVERFGLHNTNVAITQLIRLCIRLVGMVLASSAIFLLVFVVSDMW